jgi:hypothetical protein
VEAPGGCAAQRRRWLEALQSVRDADDSDEEEDWKQDRLIRQRSQSAHVRCTLSKEQFLKETRQLDTARQESRQGLVIMARSHIATDAVLTEGCEKVEAQ